MTKQEIIQGARKAVKNNVDIQVSSAAEWLCDYGLITWKHRTAIQQELVKARKIADAEAQNRA